MVNLTSTQMAQHLAAYWMEERVVWSPGKPNFTWSCKTIQRRCARFTCFYEEEKRTLEEVVHLVQTGVPQTFSVAVFTDSRSLYAALLEKYTSLDHLNSSLKDKSRYNGHDIVISICARIRRVGKVPPIQHESTAEVYSAYSSSRWCQIGSRRDQAQLAKLRTGKYKELRAYKSLLNKSDPTCPLFYQEPQYLQHWLQRYSAIKKLRFDLFKKSREFWIAWKSTLYR